MKIKQSYFKTVKPESLVPNSRLRCRFCGKLNTDLSMTIVRTDKSTSGKVFRKAQCKSCAADYEDIRKRRIAKSSSSIPVELNI